MEATSGTRLTDRTERTERPFVCGNRQNYACSHDAYPTRADIEESATEIVHILLRVWHVHHAYMVEVHVIRYSRNY